MSRCKLERFRHNAEHHNVIEPGKEIYDNIKGNWGSYFQNDNPIVLELGCGRGEYTTGMAALYPQRNFIGIDIKGSRIWKGSTVAIEGNLSNVAFLRTKIQNLDLFFIRHEVSEIWITFPDPRPKENEEKLRVTNARFLALYKQLLQPQGTVHLKTDNSKFFYYTLSEISKNLPAVILKDCTTDLYSNNRTELHCQIKTTFEKKFLALGQPINYLSFQFNEHA